MGRLSSNERMTGLDLQQRVGQVGLVAGLAMAGYLVLAVFGDAEAIAEGLARLQPAHWLVFAGLSLVNYGLRFLRWQLYLGWLGARVEVKRHALIYVAGFAFTVTPGKVGELVRSVYLRAEGVPWSPGLAALAAERLLDLTALVLLALLVLHGGSEQVGPALLFMLTVIAGVVVVTRPGVAEGLVGRLPCGDRWPRLGEVVLSLLTAMAALLRPNRLGVGLALGLVAWGAEAWGLYLLLLWLGADLGVLQCMAVYAISLLAGALSFLPGGLGGAEAAMVLLLTGAGLPLATAVVATVICRAMTLWFAVLLGLASLIALGRVGRKAGGKIE